MMGTPRKPTARTTDAIDAFCAQFDDLSNRRAPGLPSLHHRAAPAPGTQQDHEYMATSSTTLNPRTYFVDIRQWRHQIVKFAPNGKMLWVVSRPSQGSPALHMPQGLAVDPAGNVYETDTFRSQIVELSASGQQLAVWGGGTGVGQFSSPRGLAIDARGNVYVADTGNERIQELPAKPG